MNEMMGNAQLMYWLMTVNEEQWHRWMDSDKEKITTFCEMEFKELPNGKSDVLQDNSSSILIEKPVTAV